ncbi:hypothetical protein EV187_1127 [Agromyces ramosus]|uniref:Uncharacterized protein n=1 Tax=Agromyces ramosus TaxID=33879 RepID=A0A4Q7MLZ0_9MICO|nr:hypothetical protein [Agromyces ramosus]RZS68693.1 hypothetical protein EV187_1127 [Agromyces ramosus]
MIPTNPDPDPDRDRDREKNDQQPLPSPKTIVLVAAGALVVGGIIGGLAGAAIGSAGPSQELSESVATLNKQESELDNAERRVDELESEIDGLEDELEALSNQDAPADDNSVTPQPAVPAGRFPEGYPYIVPVSELPDQVRNWYEMSSLTQAVALAPGVWTELPPGADIQSAISAGVADGFCASIEAYERDYAKRDLAGTCW